MKLSLNYFLNFIFPLLKLLSILFDMRHRSFGVSVMLGSLPHLLELAGLTRELNDGFSIADYGGAQ